MVEKKRASLPAKTGNNRTLIFTVFTADMEEEKERLSVKMGKHQKYYFQFLTFFTARMPREQVAS